MKQASKIGIWVIIGLTVMTALVYVFTGCKQTTQDSADIIENISNDTEIIEENIPLQNMEDEDIDIVDGVQRDDEIDIEESIVPDNTPVPQNGTPVILNENGEYVDGSLQIKGQTVEGTFAILGDVGYIEVIKDAADNYHVIVNEDTISVMYEPDEFAKILRENYGMEYSGAQYVVMIKEGTFAETIEEATYKDNGETQETEIAEIGETTVD